MQSSTKQTLALTAAASAVLGAILLCVWGAAIAVGFLGGAAASIGNYVLISKQVNSLTSDPKPGSAVAFAFRFFLMGCVLFGMIAVLRLSPLGVIIGVSMIIPGAVIGLILGWKS